MRSKEVSSGRLDVNHLDEVMFGMPLREVQERARRYLTEEEQPDKRAENLSMVQQMLAEEEQREELQRWTPRKMLESATKLRSNDAAIHIPAVVEKAVRFSDSMLSGKLDQLDLRDQIVFNVEAAQTLMRGVTRIRELRMEHSEQPNFVMDTLGDLLAFTYAAASEQT